MDEGEKGLSSKLKRLNIMVTEDVWGEEGEKRRGEGEARMKRNSLRGNCTLTMLARIGQE